MLTVYTIVFSVAFKAKWGTGQESKSEFAIVLFSGMIIHSFFAECLNRAPTLITGHSNYVKKVVFPLEILPWMAIFSALLHFTVSLLALLSFCLIVNVPVKFGVILAPIILLPLVFMVLGMSWILASLGVYIKDLSQLVAFTTTVSLFLAPIFYPIESLPESYRSLISWNPITLPVVQFRDLMLWGTPIEWESWAGSLLSALLLCQIGYWWFQRTRRGFADVL
jgi:lipopolysaccharide transport system permease protein